MKIQNTIRGCKFNIHQMDATEYCTICDTENLVLQIANSYPAGTVLMAPNTGEVVCVDELRRVAGILGFLTDNRLVQINP